MKVGLRCKVLQCCKIHTRKLLNHCTKDMAGNNREQQFKYLLILDFEATCDKKNPPLPQEIIEFPVIKLNTRTLESEAVFHTYVEPDVHPKLTPFCTELTGIRQSQVDGQPHLTDILNKLFPTWMKEQGLLDPDNTSIFVTCGDWDLKKMLPSQCSHLKLQRNDHFRKWINIKQAFSDVTSQYPRGMMDMLRKLDIPHTGRHHSGIDDCTNIAAIAKELIKRGHVFKQTSYP
ncbi:ERI1 exoribonuclease 3-like [Ostrea edulis]|uniref:ERI1 exoribonuclease 3-like n=1 Tax=Ostrea edulis TaxID=37623 RepID=UPI0020958B1E|nr:ERI1 exoribonuclease 3-like [Ostrea edulis]